MKTLLTRWLTVTLVVFLSCPLPPPVQAAKRRSKSKAKKMPAPAVVETQPDTWPPAEFTVGILTGGEDTEGLGDILIPLWNPGNRGLLFANPRGSFTSNDEEEVNLGVGYRQLLPGDKVIVGANAYYDYRDTGDNTYDQWGVGFEILSTWIDARANYYNPDDDENIIASETDTRTHQSAQSTTTELGDPYAEDHYIVQDYATTRTLTTVTSTRTYEQYEAAFGGYDWEIGVRLPVPIQSETMEVRVFGGMYDFDQDYGGDAQGWKARGELRLFSSIFLDGGLYENDELTGSDWFAGARLNVPLDLCALSRGRNPFSTAKSRWEAAPRDLSARLTEMVMRDSQIRIETSDFIENMSLFTEETTQSRSTERETLALLADVNFVDGDEGSVDGNGSADYPFSSIQLGVDNVFGSRNVYVFNATTPYQENVVLTPGVSLIGSGILIPGVNDTTFGSGTRPIVDGVCLGPAITLADGTTVTGFQIQNTGRGCAPSNVNLPVIGSTDVNRVGILGNDATDLTLTDNLITGNSIGVLLARQGDFDLNFAHNQVINNDDRGMAIWGQGNSGSFTVAIDDSTFANNTGDGLLIDASTYDQSTIQVQDSQFLNNTGNGLLLRQANSLQAVAALSGIEATGNEASGLRIQAEDNGVYNAMISNATLRTSGEDGFQLYVTGNTTAGVWIANSLFENNVANGSQFEIESNDLFSATIENSTFADNGESGFTAQLGNNDNAGVDIENSTFSGNSADGVELMAENNGLFVATVEGSTFTNSNGSGLAAQALGNGTASVSIASSTFTASGANGAEFLAEDNDLFQVTVDDSSFSGNGTGGFGQQTENNGRVQMRIDNSLFANNGATALRAQTTGDTTFEAAIDGSRFLDNDATGLQIEGQNGDTFAVSIEGSSFSNNAGSGLDLTASGYDTALAQIQTSTFTGNGAEGAALQLDNNDQSTVTLADSQASQNTGTGIQVTIDNSTAGWIGFSNVVASQNGQMGANASIQNATEGHVEVSGLQALLNPSNGLAVAIGADTATTRISDSQANQNGGLGFSIALLGVAEATAELAGLTADENQGGGLTASLVAETNATAVLNAIQANGNTGLHGVRVEIENVEIALANLSGITANDNTGSGVEINMDNCLSSMALVSGSQANGNSSSGIDVAQGNGVIALANISGSSANGNGDVGIRIDQDSVLTSVGVVGMPEGLGASIGAITAGFGLTLPDDVIALLAEEGPVNASDNADTGVRLNIQAIDGLSLATLFDITANDNGGQGISSLVENDMGIAATIGGSSTNLSDILALADNLLQLLGTNLPLSVTGNGQMQANNNAGSGVNLTTIGELASITAMVGIEATNNGAYGVIAQNISDDLSLTALARITATDNAFGGLQMTTYSENYASIGLLADINASGNGGHGIEANIQSINGTAALLTLSTDMLRPLGTWLGNEFLGEPFVIPGTPFGPVVASGNQGDGIQAVVTGYEFALAALLDTVTSDNDVNGINLTVNSWDGISIAAVLSSDLLFDILNDALGLVPPIAYDPLGPVTASNNGGTGILINQYASQEVISLLAGIEANDNTLEGIHVDLDTNIGDAYALLAGTVTDGNLGGGGTRLELHSDLGATVSALIGAGASGNNGPGISVTQNSPFGDTYALLAGVHTVSNAGNGLDYALTAGGDAAVFMSFVESDNNTGHGANFAVSAENEIIWMAEPDFLGLASFDPTVSNMLDSFGGILPTGASSFSENDGIGLNVDLTSANGDILAVIDGVDFVGNAEGLNLTMHALNGSIMGGLFNSTASINEGHGTYVYGRGAGGNLAFGMTNSVFTSNGDNGIYIRTRYTGPVGIFSESILSTGNTNYGVRIRMASLGTNVPVIDFGGGLLGSLGQNSIHGNGHRDFRYNNGGSGIVMAQSNWWGIAPPAAGQFAGNVNYTNWLVTPPIP